MLEAALAIRTTVFIIGQEVPHELEHDGMEEICTHYLLYSDNLPIGTARWRYSGNGIKLERFAILAEFRNAGYGEIILKKVLEDVIPLGKKIYLHAQEDAVKFYMRNGFTSTSEAFWEAGIRHFQMEYFLIPLTP